jgi:staphyloferrin B biosynthesis citrate synthase
MDGRAGCRERLAAGELLVGTFVKSAAFETVELLDQAGLDVFCIDAEHAPFGRAEVALLAAAAYNRRIACLVRVSSLAVTEVGAALDAGAAGVVVPRVSSAADAAEAVRLAHYGPGGRGYSGSVRANGYGTGSMAGHIGAADRGTVVLVQVEDAAGVEQVDAIAGVEGVDGVLLGLADLTVSLGAPDQRAPAVVAAADRVRRAVTGSGAALAEVVPVDGLARARARGVGLALVGSDQQLLRSGAETVVAAAEAVRRGGRSAGARDVVA